MSEDWKNKDIPPYLKGKPANWSDKENDWNAFKGNEKLEKELASIKQKQTEILERLDKPIDTQVTGSNVEENHLVIDDVKISAGSNHRGERITASGDYMSIIVKEHYENDSLDFTVRSILTSDNFGSVTPPGTIPKLYDSNDDFYAQLGLYVSKDRVAVPSRLFQVRFFNNSDEDAHISVEISFWDKK